MVTQYTEEFIRDVRRKVHWYGFDDLKTKPESYHNSLIRILCAIDYNYSYPLIIYPINTRLVDLEDIKHNYVEYLNIVGITIYLYEPVSIYTKNNLLRAVELDSILAYIQRNNLTKVTVHMCDYRCEELLSYYTPHMKLLTNDVFLKTVALPKTTVDTNQFTKRFINLNWRYDEHRHLTAAFLSQLDSNYTWKYTVDDSVLSIFDWSNVKELDELFDNKVSSGLEHLKKNAPVELDINISAESINNITNIHDVKRIHIDHYCVLNSVTRSIEKFYADSFCDIVTETKYNQPLGNISEKTLRPISFQKPFILVAPPFCLTYLKELGFKTFSDYWDESYDSETHSQQRLIKIFKLIETLNEKPLSELNQMYDDMQSILTHNYTLLLEKFPYTNSLPEISSINKRLRRELQANKSNNVV